MLNFNQYLKKIRDKIGKTQVGGMELSKGTCEAYFGLHFGISRFNLILLKL
jgi:hypothetical protein